MRIVLLSSDQSNQHALAIKISKKFDLVGVAIESKKTMHSNSIRFYFSKLIDRILFYKIISSWKKMLQYYKDNFPTLDKTSTAIFSDINSIESINFIRKLKPDLIMVSGTSLIRNGILELETPKGIINLHTGLSPYIKGGPNCTNWCISNNTVHLIGNTIMWIDKGIDSGNIITSETVDFTGNESLNEIHIKVMEHAHELYLKALHCIINNPMNCPNVKQKDIAKGQLFLNKEWNLKAKLKFIYNLITNKFQKSIKASTYKSKKEELLIVKIHKS